MFAKEVEESNVELISCGVWEKWYQEEIYIHFQNH